MIVHSNNDSKSGKYLIPTFQQKMITRIVPQPSLSDPVFTIGEISDAVSEAMNFTLTMSFDDYTTSSEYSKNHYFTQSGWEQFSKSIKEVGIFEGIFRNREIIEFYPTRVPFIEFADVVSGVIDGVQSQEAYYVWRAHVFGKFYKRQLKDNSTSDSGVVNSSFFSHREEYALVDFYLNLQRVPKGKGASSVKIIASDSWKVTWK